MFVRWGNAICAPFSVANGVKQDGIISPVIFDMYMDELSIALNSSSVMGYLGTVFF